MVLMHSKSTKTIGKSFNFNKLTTMMFTKIRSGVVLDADQFVSPRVDALFARIAQETTQDYPYPIMPVHWMSRDPESSDTKQTYKAYQFEFKGGNPPKRTMRWGHAHPSWTHHALPWLAKWTLYVLAPGKTKPPLWLKNLGDLEDEDLLNVGLWASGVSKQWCKYDVTSPDEYSSYLRQDHEQQYGVDDKWYPKGIALMFFTAHDAKKPDESYSWLQKLWADADGHKNMSSIMYDGRWFSSGADLKAYDPNLRCVA
eukprot:TRINITY_DN9853_c0_g2_i1.p1 TRINITY_DN9853_c0_g2~~TRINITY_DN9853_c0_g2_i1.p1  ORF type:complete len:256 (+),score=26.54 TRINITY_DN9853_c0_g2_i1:154-921(+)